MTLAVAPRDTGHAYDRLWPFCKYPNTSLTLFPFSEHFPFFQGIQIKTQELQKWLTCYWEQTAVADDCNSRREAGLNHQELLLRLPPIFQMESAPETTAAECCTSAHRHTHTQCILSSDNSKAYLFHIWCADEQKEHPPPRGAVVVSVAILVPDTKLPTYLLTERYIASECFRLIQKENTNTGPMQC